MVLAFIKPTCLAMSAVDALLISETEPNALSNFFRVAGPTLGISSRTLLVWPVLFRCVW